MMIIIIIISTWNAAHDLYHLQMWASEMQPADLISEPLSSRDPGATSPVTAASLLQAPPFALAGVFTSAGHALLDRWPLHHALRVGVLTH